LICDIEFTDEYNSIPACESTEYILIVTSHSPAVAHIPECALQILHINPSSLCISRHTFSVQNIHHTTIQLVVAERGHSSRIVNKRGMESDSPSVHPYITRGCVSQRIAYPAGPSRIQLSTKLTVRVGTGCICAFGPFRVARTAKG
jgi:hypothetical protein